MTNTLLTLLLTLQLALPGQPAAPQKMVYRPGYDARPLQVWWGLIDPDLALWFARVPADNDAAFHWDWSWEGFLAALFPQSPVKEVSHAPSV